MSGRKTIRNFPLNKPEILAKQKHSNIPTLYSCKDSSYAEVVKMASEVILLDHPYSAPSSRAKIALKEKGIAYESKEQDLFNKGPLLLEMNPVHKFVPVLIHNEKPICESLIILEYIDEVWNDKSPLLPADPYQRAHSRFWADFVDKKIRTSGIEVWMAKGGTNVEAAREVMSNLKIVEAELGEKPFFGGETFGFLDIAVIPYYSWFYTLEKFGNLSMNEVCLKLVDWGERCMQRDSVSTTLHNQQETYDYFVWLRKHLGIES